MSQFIPLEQAADRLRIPKEQLNALRESGKIRAYRDGASWKFRADDLDKLADDPTALDPAAASGLELETLEEPSDSILVSDADAEDVASRPPSTVIGKPGTGKGDSDLELKLDSDVGSSAPESDVKLAAGSDVLGASASSSHILGVPGSESGAARPPSSKFEDLDELEIDLETESSKILSGSEISQLDDEGSDLELVESGVHETGRGGAGGEADRGSVAVEPVPDDDLVLGEGSGSDITLSAGDSGINLVSPADSGIALDDISLELGGSAVESLDIGEAVEHVVLEEEPDQIGDLKSDESFELTPLGELSGDESDESGSQVIALDSAAELDEGVAVLEEEVEAEVGLQPVEAEPAGLGLGVAPAAAIGIPTVADTTFTGWTVVFLGLCILLLFMGSIMMFDLMRSIWSWTEPYSVSSTLMEMIPMFR